MDHCCMQIWMHGHTHHKRVHAAFPKFFGAHAIKASLPLQNSASQDSRSDVKRSEGYSMGVLKC